MAEGVVSSDDKRLVIESISKHFYKLRALDGVSLELRPGEIVGLIGPNGSGKTTFINSVTGVLKPTAGRVMLGGKDITAGKPHRIARAGLARTFQRVRLFGSLSVLENLVVAAISVGIPRRKAAEEAHGLLAHFGLESWAMNPANTLPYGHERLTEVARALAMHPRFLFLDEPGAGLDDDETEQLLVRLHSLPRERNLGMLIVEHDMRLMMRLCDRLHVLNYGRTIAEGRPEEVRAVPEVIEAYLGGDTATEQCHA